LRAVDYEVMKRRKRLDELGFEVFERAAEYQERLHERLLRAKSALEAAHSQYAIVGGHAVKAWVSSADPSAVRSTQDIDILIARADLPLAMEALRTVGFVYRHIAGIDLFLDGPHGSPRERIHVVFAGEKVRPEYELPAPDLTEIESSESGFCVISLEALVRMKLTSYRLKDQVHLQDLVDVGLVDRSWIGKIPDTLRERLQRILDNPGM
jgi:hypothetical protein